MLAAAFCKRAFVAATLGLIVAPCLVPPSLAAPLAEIQLSLTNDLPSARCRAGHLRRAAGAWICEQADDLTLLAPDGKPAPVQIATTSTYRDGTPRWVLLSFQADVPGAAKRCTDCAPDRARRPRTS